MKFVAAAVQMLASGDKTANMAEAAQWVTEAASKGARMVALPEVFIWRGEKSEERKFAEPIPGPPPRPQPGFGVSLRGMAAEYFPAPADNRGRIVSCASGMPAVFATLSSEISTP